MDPNVTWQRILDSMASLVKQYPRNAEVIDMAYDVHSLGEWFARGGFAPNQTTTAKSVTNTGRIG